MKIGDLVMIRDGWITDNYMIAPAEIVDIAYEKNTDIGVVYLIQFAGLKSHWFYRVALKTE